MCLFCEDTRLSGFVVFLPPFEVAIIISELWWLMRHGA
jgi:hypothetical protein